MAGFENQDGYDSPKTDRLLAALGIPLHFPIIMPLYFEIEFTSKGMVPRVEVLDSPERKQS